MSLTRRLFSAPSRFVSALAHSVCVRPLKLRPADHGVGRLSDEILTDIGVPRCMLMAGPGYPDMVELAV